VRDVLESVAKIQDGVERLEVAKAVAEGFKVPESLVLERLKLSPRRPDLQPVSRHPVSTPSRKLMEAEKQLIQALVLNQSMSEAIEPLRDKAFLQAVWSWPAISRLLDSAGNVEKALSDLEDEELASEVRAAVMESPAALTLEHVMESIYKLYDAHLVKREREIREQLNSYKSEGAPRELLAERQAIMLERNRIGKGIAPNP
jgi:hypothetical protein